MIIALRGLLQLHFLKFARLCSLSTDCDTCAAPHVAHFPLSELLLPLCLLAPRWACV